MKTIGYPSINSDEEGAPMPDAASRNASLASAHNRHSALAITPGTWTVGTLALAFMAGYG